VIEVRVESVLSERSDDQPIVLLRELHGDRVLPICIGPAEANTLFYLLSGQQFVRPLTIDLMNLLVTGLKGKVRRVIVTRLESGTFFADVVLDTPEGTATVDARPSDAIALALRAGAQLFVAEKVLEEAGSRVADDETSKLNELRAELRGIQPEDFGDYRVE
jgi:bifunctional DNase/RNase